jgi:hypothetical protein
MTDRLIRLVVFALLTGFLMILVYRVPRLDLGAVVLITVALAAFDLFFARKDRQ